MKVVHSVLYLTRKKVIEINSVLDKKQHTGTHVHSLIYISIFWYIVILCDPVQHWYFLFGYWHCWWHHAYYWAASCILIRLHRSIVFGQYWPIMVKKNKKHGQSNRGLDWDLDWQFLKTYIYSWFIWIWKQDYGFVVLMMHHKVSGYEDITTFLKILFLYCLV